MHKSLSEMTLDELWQLFPIVLAEHDPRWADWYQAEETRIRSFVQTDAVRFSHIGSTAVSGIWAKPIVDILLEVPKDASMESLKTVLECNGYTCMSETENRKSFNRGYTAEGFAQQVFHLHLRYFGDHDELYFRDYLNDNPGIAKTYETLKRSLWKKYEHDRNAYTDAKTDFIKTHTALAKEAYPNRYE